MHERTSRDTHRAKQHILQRSKMSKYIQMFSKDLLQQANEVLFCTALFYYSLEVI